MFSKSVIEKLLKGVNVLDLQNNSQCLCNNVSKFSPEEYVWFINTFRAGEIKRDDIIKLEDLGLYLIQKNTDLLRIFRLNPKLVKVHLENKLPLSDLELQTIKFIFEDECEDEEILEFLQTL